MTSVHHDAAFTDDEQRTALYQGDIFLTTPDDATRAFASSLMTKVIPLTRR